MDKELRFAVVMYGGVSLAIYINGVAQEILRMSNSTSSDTEYKLNSTEIVYGLISCLLSDEDLEEKTTELITKYLNVENGIDKSSQDRQVINRQIEFKRKEVEKEILEFIKESEKNRTKFVVDILSGTSAGGINSVFLAKALANNQEIEDLKKLWIGEGDIAALLNDKRSVSGTTLKRPEKPKSLLNTRRLYLKLLEAFEGMGDDIETKSNHVDELDLFVTTTDFHGVVAPLRLNDGVVYEKKYRQVFNFRYDYDKRINKFKKKHNPMMAFASRCSSAFPFAFEPMNFTEAKSVLEDTCDNSVAMLSQLKSDINDLLPKVVDHKEKVIDWSKRDFVDGGVLDNKPFSYIVDVLSKKRSDYRGKRKLIYIEPSPEKFGNEGELKTPNAIQTAKAAVLEMPLYETIRKDIERLISRNNIIRRVNHLILNMEMEVYEHLRKRSLADINYYLAEISRKDVGTTWEAKDLGDLINIRGTSALPYYRLRIYSLTDEIALTVAKKHGIDEKLEYFTAIRLLARYWRQNNFIKYRLEADSKDKREKSVLMFLKNFDIDYRLRRLRFVLQKSEELLIFNDSFREKFKTRTLSLKRYRNEKLRDKNEENKDKYKKPFPTEIIWDKFGKYFLFEENIKNQNKDVDENETIIQKLIKDKIEYIESLLTQKETLKTSISNSNEIKAGLHRRQNYLKNQLMSARKKLRKIEKIIEDGSGSREISATKAEMERLETRIKEVESEIESSDLENKIRTYGQEIKGSQEKYNEVIAELREKENHLETYIARSRLKLNTTENQISSKQYQEILDVYCDFFQAQVKTIQEELEFVLDELKEQRENLPQLINNTDQSNENPDSKLSDIEIQKLQDLRNAEQPYLQNNDVIDQEDLNTLIESNNDYKKLASKVNKSLNLLEEKLLNIFKIPREKIRILFNEKDQETLNGAIQGYLWHYYSSFDHYDQISFPIFYQSQIGEATEIDVTRISPQDATSLVDEKKANKQKLAGESLFHFGAMLDPVWRQNDIMWGRLDGAERLIATLLSDNKYEDLRKHLTKAAHIEILHDEVLRKSDDYLTELLTDSLVNIGAGLDVNHAIEKATKVPSNQIVKTKIKSVLESSLDRENIYEYFRNYYSYNQQLEPKSLLQTISRSTKITGEVLDGVAEDSDVSNSKLRWVAKLGQIFWGLIEIAAPNNLLNALFTQWLMLLYFFEVLIIVGSTLLGKSEIQQFGIITLILTLIVHLVSFALNDFMRGGKILNLLKFISGGVFIIFAVLGIIFAYAFFYDDLFWIQINASQSSMVENYQTWQRLIPVSILIVLLVSMLAYREARNVTIRSFGKAAIVYGFLMLAIGLVFTWMVSGADTVEELRPILALEFVNSYKDVVDIVGAYGSPERNWMKSVLILDSLLFVPIYAGFLIFFSQLIRFRRSLWTIKDSGWFKAIANFYQREKAKFIKNSKIENISLSRLKLTKYFIRKNRAFKKTEFYRKRIDTQTGLFVDLIYIANVVKNFLSNAFKWLVEFSFLKLALLLITILIVVTGLADLSENYYSYRLLEATQQNAQDWMINGVYYSAHIKWFLLSTIVAVLSLAFLRGKLWFIFSLVFVLSSLLGFWGTFGNPKYIGYFMTSQLFISFVVGIFLWLGQSKFKRD